MSTKRTAKKAPVNKSFILKIVLIFVLIAAAFGLYYVTPKATPTPPKTEISLTQTPDFNACNVIKIDDIKSSFNGDLITSISDGVRVGVKAPNDTTADSCGFNITTEQSPNNSLSVQVYPYTATTDGTNKEAVSASWSQVAESDPIAYFGKDMDGDAVVYKLRIIPGGKNVMIELRQPLNAKAMDEPTALDFLVGLATKADLSVIDLGSEEL